jgi:hypothetical protein
VKALKDIFCSEKGLWAFLVPMVGSTAMLLQGSIDPQQWMDFAKVMGGIYVGGKTVQGAAAKFADSRAIGTAAREDAAAMKERLDKNDTVINEMLAAMAKPEPGDGE